MRGGAGYRALFAVRGVPRLLAAMMLARFGGQMLGVALVIFVLQRYHSPQLAGLVALSTFLPGVLVSPIAGALLDRHGRVRLVILDYWVGAATGLAVFVLATLDALPPWLLVTLTAVSSLTLPLGMTGTRSLLPLLAPRHLWDRANALDAGMFRFAVVVGPAAGGTAVGLFGGARTIALIGLTWIVASAFLFRVPEPRTGTDAAGHVLVDAMAGLRYLVGNRVLRNLAIVLPVVNLGSGILTIALPVLVLTRLHLGPREVGLAWSAWGVAGLVSNLLSGSLRTEGREHRVIALALVGYTVAAMPLAFAGSFWVVLAAMALAGLCQGPLDIAMFGMRQRAADPAWLGRALSLSMMVNGAGTPIGSLVAGPVVVLSLTAALLGVPATAAAGAVLAAFTLRPRPGVTPAASAVLNTG